VKLSSKRSTSSQPSVNAINIDFVSEILSLTRDIYNTYIKAPEHLQKKFIGFFFDSFDVKDGIITKEQHSPVMEIVKDITDAAGDVGHKDTFAIRSGRFRAGLYAALLCCLPILATCIYPDFAVRLLGFGFPIVVIVSAVALTRLRSAYWAEKAGDVFLTLLLLTLLSIR
jgi:hypothetical protein